MSHPLKLKTWKCIQLDSPNKNSIGEHAFPNTTPYKVGILVFILQRRELLWNAKHLFKLVQRKQGSGGTLKRTGVLCADLPI